MGRQKTHASKVGVGKLGPLCALRITPYLHFDDLERSTRARLEKDVKNVVLEAFGVVDEQPRNATAARECTNALKGCARGGEIQGDGGSGRGSGYKEVCQIHWAGLFFASLGGFKKFGGHWQE